MIWYVGVVLLWNRDHVSCLLLWVVVSHRFYVIFPSRPFVHCATSCTVPIVASYYVYSLSMVILWNIRNRAVGMESLVSGFLISPRKKTLKFYWLLSSAKASGISHKFRSARYFWFSVLFQFYLVCWWDSTARHFHLRKCAHTKIYSYDAMRSISK